MTCNAVPGCSNEAFCYWQRNDGTQLGTCFDPNHQRAALVAMGTPVGPDDTALTNKGETDPPQVPTKVKPVATKGAKPKASRKR